MLISSMVFFLILLSGVQHDFLNLCICCKESLIPPNRNVVCTVLRYLKTIRGSCLNPWELFESGWCSDRNRHGPRPKRFAFAIWTINPFHFLSDIFKCEEIKIGSNNYPRISLVKLSPIFKRFIHPKNTHSWYHTSFPPPPKKLPLLLAEQCLRKKKSCPGDDFMKSAKWWPQR